ncbi:DUF2336 domain-containing protein [Roseomonas sp. PWR1]|uniref:DUF2336 domain-containing protein n=1 Tax=Roseomonas nitratireducens TaxID=2820810 RepID=A0ABS4AQR6_9PROT|nr:DUF2336 domain-containing protein [Neoroseomonas nitratireducens]MBP0463686.1 DUF2336 domain-containing protein [Neoroseomonas nitratireducens]
MTDLTRAARILEEGDVTGREALAADPAAPPEALYFLMSDRVASVRGAVARNPSSPFQTFGTLAADPDDGVRGALAARLAQLAPGLGEPQRDRLADAAWGALARLAEDTAEDIRIIIAEAVSTLPDAPRATVLALAQDRAMRVAEPVIRLSPMLTEEDLLSLVAAPPVAETLTAVARRPTISERVADALVDSGDDTAITALLLNDSAAIRESTLDALVVQAAERTHWQAPLVKRPALPPRAAVALSRFVAEELLAPLAARTDLPAEASATIRRAVAVRLAGRARPGESASDAGERALILLRAGALDDAAMLRAARAAEADFVKSALAALAGVPLSEVEHVVVTRCNKSIAGLCRRASLSEATAEAVAMLLAPPAPTASASVAPSLVGDGELRWRIDALARAAGR